MEFQTEYLFTLPKGYVDRDGNVHREGVMRIATAGDEILPLKDPKVQENPKYLSIILLSRVITRLGGLITIDTKVIEGLYTIDLAYLQNLYKRINTMENPVYNGVCPYCGETVSVPVNFMGDAN